jgi:chemotaxis protein histidine kinase CheA
MRIHMTLDPDLLDAYRLFVEEALELLQQIQETLLELPRNPDLSKTYSLVKAVNTIATGAAQVKLTDIHSLASRFENIFRWLWQEKAIVDSELGDLLWRAYDCLRQSLLAQIQTNPEAAAEALAKAEPIYQRLEAYFTPKPKNDFSQGDNPKEKTASFVRQEVDRALADLETLVSGRDVPNFSEALKSQMEVFFSLGELSSISGFVAVSQITQATLQVNPQTAPVVGQIVLESLKGIWQATANSNFQEESDAIEQLFDLDISDLPPVENRVPTPAMTAKEPAKERLAVTAPQKLKTSKSLVWLSDSAAFVAPSNKVREILLPQDAQLNQTGKQLWLSWQGQEIPVYCLSKFLQYNGHDQTDSTSKPDPMLVVLDRDREIVAIELAVEGLISRREISLIPFNAILSPPSYCYGCTLLESDRLAVVIDLEALLAQTLDRATQKSKDVPTILAIDDSSTSRRILALTLEKAGYRAIQARNGEDGLLQLQQHPETVLVVSDIEMPKLNGFGFLKSCRQNPQLAKLPVILLSTYNSNRHLQMAKELGAAGYLSKPFNEGDFLAQVEAILQKNRY